MENEEIGYRVHWIAFTVHASAQEAFMLYDLLFKESFGQMIPLGHGGRGFREIFHSLNEFKIYLDPISGKKEFFCYEIPGAACDMIDWSYLPALGELLEGNYKDRYKFTRFDFAFDNVPFTPLQVEAAIENNELRCLAKRETLALHSSPYVKKENGEVGTCTVEFGSRSSERMIRVYDKRGFTRLEFQMKDNRAQLVAQQVFSITDINQWYDIVLSHLLDYIDFKTDWWETFIYTGERANATLSTPKEISMTKMVQWLEKQVAPALSVAIDVLPKETIDSMLLRGRARRGSRYDLLLGKFDQHNDGVIGERLP